MRMHVGDLYEGGRRIGWCMHNPAENPGCCPGSSAEVVGATARLIGYDGGGFLLERPQLVALPTLFGYHETVQADLAQDSQDGCCVGEDEEAKLNDSVEVFEPITLGCGGWEKWAHVRTGEGQLRAIVVRHNSGAEAVLQGGVLLVSTVAIQQDQLQALAETGRADSDWFPMFNSELPFVRELSAFVELQSGGALNS